MFQRRRTKFPKKEDDDYAKPKPHKFIHDNFISFHGPEKIMEMCGHLLHYIIKFLNKVFS